jgi:hypothetical protein
VAERASVSQHIQIGVETTPGTSVAASKQLRSIGFTPSPKVTVEQFRPAGQKYISLAILGEEWVEATMDGNAVYDELVYPMSSLLGAATVTPGTAGNTASYSWKFKPLGSAADAAKTFTIEHGDPNSRADKFTGALVTDTQFTMDRTKFTLTGTVLGQNLQDAITMTATPVMLPLVPILPSKLNVWIDPTASALGTTKMSRVISADWHMTNKYGPVWPLDSTQASYAATIELVPTLTGSIVMEADAAGMGLLTALRSGATQYIRIAAVGPLVPTCTSATYAFTLDMAAQIINTTGFSDSNGLYAIGWDFACAFDNTMDTGTGGAMILTLVNSLATL